MATEQPLSSIQKEHLQRRLRSNVFFSALLILLTAVLAILHRAAVWTSSYASLFLVTIPLVVSVVNIYFAREEADSHRAGLLASLASAVLTIPVSVFLFLYASDTSALAGGIIAIPTIVGVVGYAGWRLTQWYKNRPGEHSPLPGRLLTLAACILVTLVLIQAFFPGTIAFLGFMAFPPIYPNTALFMGMVSALGVLVYENIGVEMAMRAPNPDAFRTPDVTAPLIGGPSEQSDQKTPAPQPAYTQTKEYLEAKQLFVKAKLCKNENGRCIQIVLPDQASATSLEQYIYGFGLTENTMGQHMLVTPKADGCQPDQIFESKPQYQPHHFNGRFEFFGSFKTPYFFSVPNNRDQGFAIESIQKHFGTQKPVIPHPQSTPNDDDALVRAYDNRDLH